MHGAGHPSPRVSLLETFHLNRPLGFAHVRFSGCFETHPCAPTFVHVQCMSGPCSFLGPRDAPSCGPPTFVWPSPSSVTGSGPPSQCLRGRETPACKEEEEFPWAYSSGPPPGHQRPPGAVHPSWHGAAGLTPSTASRDAGPCLRPLCAPASWFARGGTGTPTAHTVEL